MQHSPKQTNNGSPRGGRKNTHDTTTLPMEKVDALIALVDTLAARQQALAVSLEGVMVVLAEARERLRELRGVGVEEEIGWDGVVLGEGGRDDSDGLAEGVDDDRLHMRHPYLTTSAPARGRELTIPPPETPDRPSIPNQASAAHRTVQIANLPSPAPLDILMPLLDTGRILAVAVDHGRTTTSITLTFLHEAAARALVQRRTRDPIIFGTQAAHVYMAEPPSGVITEVQARLLAAGVTRCLHFSRMLENLTKKEFDKIVARMAGFAAVKDGGEEGVVVVLYSKKDFRNGEVRMGFASLELAAAAKALFDGAVANQGVGASWKWRGCLVEYVPDEGTEATERYLARLGVRSS